MDPQTGCSAELDVHFQLLAVSKHLAEPVGKSVSVTRPIWAPCQ
jgi:hypothetical protein